MLSRSRVNGDLDVARLAEAVSRPGIDPRTWVSLAIVGKVRLDAKLGVVADVTLMPSGQSEVARVATPYAGKGWGMHLPVYADDEVVVEAPSGDPNQGLIITQRLHSPSDPPSADAVAHPQDVNWTVEPKQNWRLRTSGGGTASINSDNVRFGSEDASEQYLLGTTYRAKETIWHTSLNTFLIGAATFGGVIAVQAPIVAAGFTAAKNASGLSPADKSALDASATAMGAMGAAGTAVASLATAAATALNTFEGMALSFLSNVVKGK